MRTAALWLLAAINVSAQTRYARLGEIDGAVETQIHPTEAWKPGLRNTPLVEASSIRTLGASHAEIELDDGSVLRLAENSVCELSDYTRLSTGQRIFRSIEGSRISMVNRAGAMRWFSRCRTLKFPFAGEAACAWRLAPTRANSPCSKAKRD